MINICSRLAVVVAFASMVLNAAADTSSPSPLTATQRLSLDRGWFFHLGDIPFPVIKGHSDSYANAKAGKAWGAAAPDYDDSDWRMLNLPHDWAVEGPFDPNANESQGYRPRGMAWYRRYLRLDPSDHGRSLELEFDGIATHCTVWVNGTVVHRNWCGYTGFTIDLTPLATYGDQLNTIAIQVDANAQEGWWYEGAGIYRHTWLLKRNMVHLATDGVWANPVRNPDGTWQLPVEATIGNEGNAPADTETDVELLDPEGNVVAQGTAAAQVQPLEEAVAKLSIPVMNPRLWSVDTPTLYTVRTTVKQGGTQIDQKLTRCGFRTIRFDPNKGFFLNDQPLKLKGTCNHQDAAGVGVAVPDSIWDYRIRRLKELGSNAYRCAHNPPAAEFLDACDRLGMLVMDENRNFNVSPDYMRQLQWMVRRDRNHPSVILWSVFNEEPMQGTEDGYEMVRRMKAAVNRLDTTRPVTAAMSGGLEAPINVSQAVDVVGFNYQQQEYDRFHQEHPNQPLTSSEDTSSFMTREIYKADDARCYADSYDDSAATWGATHRDAWKAVATRPFVAGDFVWTGFDYRGEPQKFAWPSVSSVFGIMDTCGFPKAAYYIHQAAWIDDHPVLHLIPHWNWKGSEGKPIKVMAFTNTQSVELFLNGKSLGEQQVDRWDGNQWQVNFAPGKLEAVGKNGGKEVIRFAEETTGAAVALKLTPDRPSLAGDGADAEPVTVSAVDAEGREVPTANLPVKFHVKGPIALIGTGNGDNTSHEPEQINQRSLFNGLAQVTLQSKLDSSGPAVLVAESKGLHSAEADIDVKQAPSRPAVPATAPIFTLDKWWMSPISAAKPNPHVKLGATDMNTWSNVQGGSLQKYVGGTWETYRIVFTPVAGVQKEGGSILFKEITGTAEVWSENHLLGKKSDPSPGELEVKIPPESGPRAITVMVNSNGAPQAGLSGVVIVTP